MPRGADVVAYPDHPLLLRGPDILAVHQGRLSCYFVYASGQSYTAPSEQSRILLTRLALAPDASVVMVVEDAGQVGRLERTVPLYDELVAPGLNSIGSIPAGRVGFGRGAELVSRVRPYHDERFAQAWTATLDAAEQGIRHERTLISTAELDARRKSGGVLNLSILEEATDDPEPREVADVRELDFARQPLRRRSDVIREFNRGVKRAVELDYYIDRRGNRLEESAEYLTAGLAVLQLRFIRLGVDLRPTLDSFDGLKPFRAAAFAGIEFENAEWIR